MMKIVKGDENDTWPSGNVLSGEGVQGYAANFAASFGLLNLAETFSKAKKGYSVALQLIQLFDANKYFNVVNFHLNFNKAY
jgi:hypothetical protein